MRRHLVVPEVLQTSATDCGPACLKCILDGFGRPIGYGPLREACKTGLDGTSIDALEEIALQLGFEAEQLLLPEDHLLRADSTLLPALVVIRQPNGIPHFVVLWNRVGSMTQVMDPAAGRRLWSGSQLVDQCYVHAIEEPASVWLERSSEFLARNLRRALADLGVAAPTRAALEARLDGPSWRSAAALDASARMTSALVRAGGLPRGPAAASLLQRAYEDALANSDAIPAGYWFARPVDPSQPFEANEPVRTRGALLLRIAPHSGHGSRGAGAPPPALAAAMTERPLRPGRALIRTFVDSTGGWTASLLALGALVAGAAGVAEGLLLRCLADLERLFRDPYERAGALALAVGLLGLALATEFPVTTLAVRAGRHLEIRLRAAFLRKLPRLADSYFRSRPRSDVAERVHSLHLVRGFPLLATRLLLALSAIALTGAGLVWLDRDALPAVALALAVAIGSPLLIHGLVAERDMEVRTHTGALGRCYLEGLLGLVPARAHGAEDALRREHESLTAEWVRACRSLLRLAVGAEAIQLGAGFLLAATALLGHLDRAGGAGAALLFVYWALDVPVLAQELAGVLRQYPSRRNVMLRVMEPLGAGEERGEAVQAPRQGDGAPAPAELAFENVRVIASGSEILRSLSLRVAAGSHVAIVGPSGAGKSTLAALLLGWQCPAEGTVRVDGEVLGAVETARLRMETVWLDPAVQLWNDALLDNILYGNAPETADLGKLLAEAELHELLDALPSGMQSPLGENGGALSGGEGQRVRLARARGRERPRLVILDEPFRGLDRARRRALLDRARQAWRGVTLLCITHDIADTAHFDRVLVLEGGRLVEDDRPAELRARAGGRYRALLNAEESLAKETWAGPAWRHVRLAEGELWEEPPRVTQAERGSAS